MEGRIELNKLSWKKLLLAWPVGTSDNWQFRNNSRNKMFLVNRVREKQNFQVKRQRFGVHSVLGKGEKEGGDQSEVKLALEIFRYFWGTTMRRWRGGNANLAADARIVSQADSLVLQILQNCQVTRDQSDMRQRNSATPRTSRVLYTKYGLKNMVIYEES